MGLPGFFAWILKHYAKDILINCLKKNPKYLYIDANCLFHPECFKILEGYQNSNLEELKEYMFKRIVNFLDFLEKFVDPSVMMYIAVDGSAPLAKIVQQRKRRYSTEINAVEINEIKIKHGISIADAWSNTSITPGTEFMQDLHKYLLKHYKTKDHTKLKYIYSSYHTPGEGEHKILQHIKKNTQVDDDIIIYGLDADLIFLAMASNRSNIYLLREQTLFQSKKQIKTPSSSTSTPQFPFMNTPNSQASSQFPKQKSDISSESNDTKDSLEEKKEKVEIPFDYINDVSREMTFVSIKETRCAYNKDIKQRLENLNWTAKIKEIDFSNDLIFICFLLGNDFLPHFPSINIHNDGLDELIESYMKTLLVLKYPLIEGNVKINNVFFQMMIEDMGIKEEEYFKYNHNDSMNKIKRRRCFEEDAFKKDMWELNNLKNVEVNDTINLGKDEKDVWKYRYYQEHFKLTGKQDKFIDDLAKLYINGIKWITEYYFFECPDWRWSYPCHHAPFISDIAKYMKDNNVDLNQIQFTPNKHVPIMSQLVSVLPPACKYYLPESYHHLASDSPIEDMFPAKVQVDSLYKSQRYQCVPLIPYLDINRVLKATANLQLTKKEKERSEIIDDIEF
jgi:5'-3' exonuclease